MSLNLYNGVLVGCLLILSNLLSQASCMEKKDTYLLETGGAAQERLERIDEAYGSFSRALLESLCSLLPENPRILSVGCGAGTVERYMAQLWPKAKITAIDNAQGQLDVADKEASKLGITNIDFVLNDANNLADTDCYDLVYARFLLIHTQDSLSILKRMANAAKPGALIVCGEISSSSFYCDPPNEFYEKALQLTEKIAQTIGVDYDIGAKLPEMMAELGLELVQQNRQEPDRSNLNVKRQLVMSLREAKPKLLAAKFDEQELNELLEELDKGANQDASRISMSDLFQVVGRKR